MSGSMKSVTSAPSFGSRAARHGCGAGSIGGSAGTGCSDCCTREETSASSSSENVGGVSIVLRAGGSMGKKASGTFS